MGKSFRHNEDYDADTRWASHQFNDEADVASQDGHTSKRYRNLNHSSARKKVASQKRRAQFDDEFDRYN